MAGTLLTACGGGSSGTPAPVAITYAASATAGTGGTVSPSSATLSPGGTTTFTVTPKSGYVVSGVIGCGGTLSGTTYTTGVISANCTVTASFAAAFTWESGSDTSDANGVYGTQGAAAAGNVPGARHTAVTWTDASGNLWLFGGYGVGSPIFTDLWEYSPATNGPWTWVGGSNTTDAAGVYGTQGVGAATNVPGSLGGALSWTDGSGDLWLFGGYGYDSTGNRGWLNAIWKYSPESGMWTWMGGSDTVNVKGVYGTEDTAAATNVPGARSVSGRTYASGTVWLFGGYGYDSAGNAGELNDLWKYLPASGEWTWVGGSSTVNASGVYGTQGVAASGNVPGARNGAAVSTDASGNLWVFGGYGYDSTGASGYLNDLWEYSPASGMWTWVGGSNIVSANGTYGTQGTAASTNLPGARYAVAAWTDASGKLWLFGGTGYDSTGTFGELNDLWEYSPATGEATWVAGSNTVNASGVYGTLGAAATTNVPGARDATANWIDAGGNLWLFGGEGYNYNGANPATPEWNDLWKYPTQ